MVVFGRPKGDPCGICGAARGSYKQWEEGNLPPQVVFEILSPNNTKREMARKFVFYEDHGVEEYYIYDPDADRLEGWLKRDGMLNEIDNFSTYISPRLGIRFDLSVSPMQVFCSNGRQFLSYGELDALLQEERLRAEQAQQRAEQAQQRANQLAERLRQLGIDPDQI